MGQFRRQVEQKPPTVNDVSPARRWMAKLVACFAGARHELSPLQLSCSNLARLLRISRATWAVGQAGGPTLTQFLAHHRHCRWCREAQAYFAAIDADDNDAYIIADHDSLIHASCENQHKSCLLYHKSPLKGTPGSFRIGVVRGPQRAWDPSAHSELKMPYAGKKPGERDQGATGSDGNHAGRLRNSQKKVPRMPCWHGGTFVGPVSCPKNSLYNLMYARAGRQVNSQPHGHDDLSDDLCAAGVRHGCSGLHSAKAFDDQFRSLIEGVTGRVQHQVIIRWVGRVLV